MTWRRFTFAALVPIIVGAGVASRAAHATVWSDTLAARDTLAVRDTLAASDTLAAEAVDSTFATPEPPEDTAPGADYVEDREPRLPPGEIETSWGYSGRGASNIRRRQRVRVREAGFEAGVREGRADALPGAMARVRLGAARVSLGGAPRSWGQSLMVGAPSEPWLDDGLGGAAGRGNSRSRDGVEYERGDDIRLRIAALHGASASFVGLNLERHGAGAGVLLVRESASRAPRAAGSVWTARGPAAGELAYDGQGRWRTQTVWHANETPTHVALGVRVGETGFHSASTARAGPASAVSAALERRLGAISCSSLGALWRFRGERTGARAALELRARLPQHESFAIGAEERHGFRTDSERESGSASPFRQRVWAGWNGGSPELAMSLRHELWGSRGGLHAIRRGVTSAGFKAAPRPGISFGVTHTLYRSGSGETQYVGEQEDDRQILRALAGSGRRTRFETGIPAAGGEIRAALILTAAVRPSASVWTIDWTRRARRN